MNNHPLTLEKIAEISITRLLTEEHCNDMRLSADWQLEKVLAWLKFGYQEDPNLSRERKHRGGFKEIAIALEKAMRPTQEDN